MLRGQIRRLTVMPATLLALAASIGALLAAAVGAPAAVAAEGSCPAGHGGSAAVEWGINGSEQLAAGFRSVHEGAPNHVLGLGDVRSVQAGFKFAVALRSNCTLVSWGSNDKAQLGNGNHLQAQNRPAPVVNLNDVKEVSLANAHALALRYDGTVWTWGASEFGERGNGEKGFEHAALAGEAQARPRDEPIPVPGLEHVVQLASGGMRDYALLASGEVVAWGENQNGDLGIAPLAGGEEQCFGETHARTPVACSTVPRPVMLEGKPLTGVERIAAGGEAAYAVRALGREVLAWGENSKGQLGTGSTERATAPQRVAFTPPSPVVEIEGGARHALARLQNGRVYAWGADDSGQLGFTTGSEASEACGPHACLTSPRLVEALSHVVQVAAGESNSLALKEEESGAKVAYSFGRNGLEEVLGLGELAPESTSTPTPIAGLGSVGGISASSNIGVAWLESGAPPPALLALAPGHESLQLSWTTRAEAYRLRWRPLGTKPWSKLLEREATCRPEEACHYEQSIEGLGPQPYEVDLVNARLSEGKTGHEKSRYIAGTPAPAEGAPLNTAPPVISGTVQQGQNVTVSSGTWSGEPTSYAYQWLRCEGYGEGGGEEELGGECEAIEGATGPAYTPQAADVRHSLRVSVKATNAAGWSLAVTKPEVVLAPGEETLQGAPENTSPPTIAGVTVQGRTLSEHHGSWEVEPTSYTYKWLRCRTRTSQGIGSSCVPIAGATAQSYVLTAEDIGMWVEVQETAITSGGFNVATSEALEAIPPEPPVNVSPPTVAGTIEKGQTLSAHEGTWTNGAKAPAWQWLRCGAEGGGCVAIAGATKKTYKLEAEDVGHTLAVSESVENAIARSAPVNSSPTTIVPVPPPAPEGVLPPTISGIAQQGQVLTENQGTWTNQPTSYSYTWKRCGPTGSECKAIAGAGKQTYTLTAADVGHTIVVKETATNAGGSTIANSLPSTPVLGAAPVIVSPPSITGPAQVGGVLGAAPGAWTNEPGEYSYQWMRCDLSGNACAPIAAATGATYTPANADVGASIRVQVTATNATGPSAPALSPATAAVVPAAPAVVAIPTVTGVAQEGQTLTEHAASWANNPTGHTLQWLRCEATGCTPIEGASAHTYVLGAADVGSRIVARETASNAGGWEAASSEPTAPVATPVTVSAIEPAAGPTAGGTQVTITGTHLDQATGVQFGSVAATHVEVLSAAKIRAASPAGSGTVDVTVTLPGGGASVAVPQDRFTYVPQPVVAALSPGKTAAGSEATVTITGSAFSGAGAVNFGGRPAVRFTVNSATSITATAPSAPAGVVDVTVTTLGGTSAAAAADRFYYTEAPEFGRCVAMKPTGSFSNGSCTAPAAKSAFEWEPGLLHAGLTISSRNAPSFETVGRRTISCTAASGQGAFDGPRELAEQMTFSGCESSAQKCFSAGAAAGEIRTAGLTATLVWEARSTSSVALLVSAEKAGEPLLKMQCGASAVEVKGSLLVPVKESVMASSQVLKFAAVRGIQEPSEYEGASGKVKAYLEASFSGGPFERTGLKAAVTQAGEEAVEINPVV
jgi:alpha-tubulin suppressor-like RCC1 family protein